jgi:hypothetical protein
MPRDANEGGIRRTPGLVPPPRASRCPTRLSCLPSVLTVTAAVTAGPQPTGLRATQERPDAVHFVIDSAQAETLRKDRVRADVGSSSGRTLLWRLAALGR